MPASGISSPPVSFQQWLHWANLCMLRYLLSNIRTRNWLCCWRTAGPLQHKIPMTHNDGIFSSKGPTPFFFFEAITLFHFWKFQVAFLIKNSLSKCYLYSSCPFEGDSHRTVLLPVASSVELEYPSLHKRFVVKLFSFVKPQTSEKLVSKLFKYNVIFKSLTKTGSHFVLTGLFPLWCQHLQRIKLLPVLQKQYVQICLWLGLKFEFVPLIECEQQWLLFSSFRKVDVKKKSWGNDSSHCALEWTSSSVNNPTKDFLKLKKTMKIFLNQ